jgi:hypothetical protein
MKFSIFFEMQISRPTRALEAQLFHNCLEQAVFADELSDESIAAFDEIARAQWQALLAATVPKLQALIDADAAAGRKRDRRVRIGLYTYHAAMSEPPAAPAPAAPNAEKRRRTARKDR